jgi:hypothetical protein
MFFLVAFVITAVLLFAYSRCGWLTFASLLCSTVGGGVADGAPAPHGYGAGSLFDAGAVPGLRRGHQPLGADHQSLRPFHLPGVSRSTRRG